MYIHMYIYIYVYTYIYKLLEISFPCRFIVSLFPTFFSPHKIQSLQIYSRTAHTPPTPLLSLVARTTTKPIIDTATVDSS